MLKTFSDTVTHRPNFGPLAFDEAWQNNFRKTTEYYNFEATKSEVVHRFVGADTIHQDECFLSSFWVG